MIIHKIMKLPKITSTTELQRNISVLTKSPEDEIQIITKGTKEIGVYLPMPLYKKTIEATSTEAEGKVNTYKAPKDFRDLFREVNPVEYQRNIRKEY